MTAMDFPSPATAGDKYPVPAVPNKPVYTFDGVKWTTFGDEADDVIGASTTLPKMDATPAVIGTEANWSRGDHVHPTDTTRAPVDSPVFTGDARAPTPVGTDNDTTLATTAYVQAVQAATFAGGGAPIEGLAANGLQINGSMDVSQELALGTGVTANNTYVCDGWKLGRAGTNAVTASLNNVVVSAAPYGFQNSLGISVSTAQTSLGGSDAVYIYQPVEGYRTVRLAWGTANAQSITIGFWSCHIRTGIYSVAVGNGSRSYTTTYTQNTTGLMQYNTVTIPGDTMGTWQKTTSTGFTLTFAMAAGATVTASAVNTWLAGNFIAAPGQVNGVGVTSDAFYITGVAIIPGVYSIIPALRSSLLLRPYDQELAICKRYYEETPISLSGYDTAGYEVGFSNLFSVEKRVVPASTTKSGSSAINFTVGVRNATTKHLYVGGSVTSAGTYNWSGTIINNARL